MRAMRPLTLAEQRRAISLPSMRRGHNCSLRHPLCLAVLICVVSGAVVSHAQDPVSFFVEIQPARSTFFTGDSLTVNVFSNQGQLVNLVQVEILAGDRVVLSYQLLVQMPGREIRRHIPHFRSGLGIVVDEKLPPGTYRPRARQGTTISESSAPFTVEGWGASNAGIQVSLTAPASLASGESLVVTLSLRNTSDRPLRVPSNTTEECAMPWLTFDVFDREAATGRGLRDDRKDCGRPPTVLLQPGEVTTYHVNLRRLNEPGFDPRQPFTPGRGRIRIGVLVWGAAAAVDGERTELWRGRAVSNEVSITVQ